MYVAFPPLRSILPQDFVIQFATCKRYCRNTPKKNVHNYRNAYYKTIFNEVETVILQNNQAICNRNS